MIYLSLQACFTLPLMNMIRFLHLLKAFAIGGWHWAGRPPPADTPPYHLFWAKSLLGATVGISFAAINPIAVLFALAYLCGCYALFCKNLLFDFTNHHDSCGRVMWPSASKWCAAPVRPMMKGVRGAQGVGAGCVWRGRGRGGGAAGSLSLAYDAFLPARPQAARGALHGAAADGHDPQHQGIADHAGWRPSLDRTDDSRAPAL